MAKKYTTIQEVLKTAGMWQRILADTPAGSANGTNKVFTVDHKPLADYNFDDTVDHSDVTAYVNGAAVPVATVNATTGAVTLVTAPLVSDVVTIDYAYSTYSAEAVERVINEAQAWVDEEMLSVVNTPYTGTVPQSIRRITRWYAAGLLMGEETGIATSTDQLASEGAAKLKQAEKWLSDYRARQQANGVDEGTVVVPTSRNDGRLFQRYDEANGRFAPLSDEQFNVNRSL